MCDLPHVSFNIGMQIRHKTLNISVMLNFFLQLQTQTVGLQTFSTCMQKYYAQCTWPLDTLSLPSCLSKIALREQHTV